MEALVTKAAHLTLDTFGSPKEPETETAEVKAPSTPRPSLTDLLLPDQVTEILVPPLQTLGLKLESTKTPNEYTKKLITHHVVRTSKGGIVLLHLEAAVVQDQADQFWPMINSLGFNFAQYTALFIFSFAEQVAYVYEDVLRGWQRHLVERAEFLLGGYIRRLAEMDSEYIVYEVRDKFGLPEAAEESATIDRRILRELFETHFNLEEIRDLCFDLKVEFDDLEGSGRKIPELILFFERYERLPELVSYFREKRPTVSWDV